MSDAFKDMFRKYLFLIGVQAEAVAPVATREMNVPKFSEDFELLSELGLVPVGRDVRDVHSVTHCHCLEDFV